MARRTDWLAEALAGSVDPEVIGDLDDPMALHLVAIHHNWDDGPTVPEHLAEHQRLDRGTAMHLFWLAQPPEILVAVGRSEEDEGDHLCSHLITGLRTRLIAGAFPTADIAVDLRRDHQFNRLMIHRLRQADVPNALIGPTPGSPFDEPCAIRRFQT